MHKVLLFMEPIPLYLSSILGTFFPLFHHNRTEFILVYLNKLPSELLLPLFFFCPGEGVPWRDPCGEGVAPSLLLPDILRFFPSFPRVFSGDLNLNDPFPELPPPLPFFPSLASFSSSSSSNGLRSLGPSPSKRELLGGQWLLCPPSSWMPSSPLSKGLRWWWWGLMLRLILRNIKALSRVGPPPFRRTGSSLRTGITELVEGGQGGRNLGREREGEVNWSFIQQKHLPINFIHSSHPLNAWTEQSHRGCWTLSELTLGHMGHKQNWTLHWCHGD